MKRATFAMLLLAASATPAAARSEALLDCASQELSTAFRDKIADAMLASENAENDALFGHLGDVARSCAARFALSDAQTDAYFAYALARLPRDAYIDRLARAGIAAALIDEALDFGPGRANPTIEGDLTPAQRERLGTTLGANGVDLAKVSREAWDLVGAYVAASAQLRQSEAQLP